jgi:AcrR family transcriptional regulator
MQRDLAKRRTREALLNAGLAEFAARGFDIPSLDGICARAGYTRGAFYVHFRDRDDLLVAVTERALKRFLDALIATGNQAYDLPRTVDQFMGGVATAVATATRSRRRRAVLLGGMQLHRLLEACVRSRSLRTRVVALVQDAVERLSRAVAAGQAMGTVQRDVDPHQVATVLVGAAIGLVAEVEIGMPLDVEAGHGTILRLLAIAGTARGGAAVAACASLAGAARRGARRERRQAPDGDAPPDDRTRRGAHRAPPWSPPSSGETR